MTRVRLARLARIAVVAFAALVPTSGTIFADPAGPTDYRSEILSIEPPTEAITIDVIGGDSFIRLRADPATEVLVLGYFAEPYLRFLPGGIVEENRNSPTTYQNEERYGSDAPDFASADADPDWVKVASDGSYAWHDHRAHWMQPIRPAGAAPGDRIVEQVIPLIVDGTGVDVTVISTWQPEPSNIPLVLGVVFGLASIGGAWRWAGRNHRWPIALFPVSATALLVGAWQYLSLPSETGPRPVWFALPAIALLASVVPLVPRLGSTFAAAAAGLIVSAQLAIWGYLKRDGLFAAIVPTDAPQWADRATVAAALVAGIGGVVVALQQLFPAAPGTKSVATATSPV